MKKELLLEGLTEEQIEKIKNCKSRDEILELAKNEGIQLNDEQLEAVTGGACTGYAHCPRCGSPDFSDDYIFFGVEFHCNTCGYEWDDYLF